MNDSETDVLEIGETSAANVQAEAQTRIEQASDFWFRQRDLAREDWKLRAGEHWDPEIVIQRMLNGEPSLTINRCAEIVRHLVGDNRKKPLRVQFSAVDAETGRDVRNPDGTEDFSVAEVYNGLSNHIDRLCDAQSAYDWAYQCMVTGGEGYWLLGTQESPYTIGHRDIIVRKVSDPFSVHLDPAAILQDPTKANFGLVTEWFDRYAFEDKYGKRSDAYYKGDRRSAASVVSNYGHIDRSRSRGFQWFNQGKVLLADYYVKRRVQKELTELSDGRTIESKQLLTGIGERLAQVGVLPLRTEKVWVPVVYWYRLSGRDVLEGPVEFPSHLVPIVPCFGETVLHADGYYTVEGVLRHAHDPQKAINTYESALASRVSKTPKAKAIVVDELVAGYEDEWGDMYRGNKAYLRVRNLSNVRDPILIPPMSVEPGLVERATAAHKLFEMTTGRRDEDLGQASNAISGAAITARQEEGDASSYVYADNFRKALAYAGRVRASMIPRVYDVERMVRIRDDDGTQHFVRINQVGPEDPETGRRMILNDLTRGMFDVAVEPAPAYKTQRREVQEMMERVLPVLATALPQGVAPAVVNMFRNADFQGADEMARMFDSLVSDDMKAAREEQDGDDEQPEITPQIMQLVQQLVQEQVQQLGLDVQNMLAQAQQMSAQADVMSSQAQMAKAQAELGTVDAQNREARAKEVSARAAEIAARADLIEARRGPEDLHTNQR